MELTIKNISINPKTLNYCQKGNHWCSSHYAVTHVHIQGRSPNVIKVIFHTTRSKFFPLRDAPFCKGVQSKRITACSSSLPLMCIFL